MFKHILHILVVNFKLSLSSENSTDFLISVVAVSVSLLSAATSYWWLMLSLTSPSVWFIIKIFLMTLKLPIRLGNSSLLKIQTKIFISWFPPILLILQNYCNQLDNSPSRYSHWTADTRRETRDERRDRFNVYELPSAWMLVLNSL